jgi:hypothetical protein
MTRLDHDKLRRTDSLSKWAPYSKEWERQRKKDYKRSLMNTPATKAQVQYIAKLRREKDFMVKSFPNTRRKASALIRELEAAPPRAPDGGTLPPAA